MPTLTTEQKVFVIKGFARYMTAPEVAVAVKEKFGVEVPSQHLCQYHPDTASFRAAEKWRELFHTERKAFLTNVDAIGIANKSFRLQSLAQLHAIAMSRKNVKQATEILEQAAKEMGEVFTNRREVKSDVRSVTATMTTDQLRQEILKDLNTLGIEAPKLQIGVVKDDGTKH